MILIGTVHPDVYGPLRLRKLLEELKPESITIESPVNVALEEMCERLSEEKRKGRKEIASLSLPDISRRLLEHALNIARYEILVSCGYAAKYEIPIHAVDHPKMILEPIDVRDSVREYTFTEPHLRVLERVGFEKVIALTGKTIDLMYSSSEIFQRWILSMSSAESEMLIRKMGQVLDKQFQEEREQFMADNIAERNPAVHIGGMMHVFDIYGNLQLPNILYHRLGEAVTRRIRLCEVQI